jgi:hypothetical protein
MSEVLVGIIGLAALLALFASGIELGFGMAVIGFLGFGGIKGFDSAFN